VVGGGGGGGGGGGSGHRGRGRLPGLRGGAHLAGRSGGRRGVHGGGPAGVAGPVSPPGLLGTGEWAVPADWIDYNGHMMDGYYGLAFSDATEVFLDHVGLGEAYRQETGSGMYTVESHLCYRRSARAGQQLRFTTQVLGA